MQRLQVPSGTPRLPWWGLMVLGAVCVVVGALLVTRPFTSLIVLVGLVVGGLFLNGWSEVASAGSSSRPWLSWLVGMSWIGAGLFVAVWPGVTIQVLAIAIGVALVVAGAGKILAALFGGGSERLLLGVGGLTNVIFGVLALTMPVVTVFVLAVILGLQVAWFGVRQIVTALALRRSQSGSTKASRQPWPRWLQWTSTITAFVLALGGTALAIGVRQTQPDAPGPFYTAPSPLPAGPLGTIIRSEIMDGFYPGATAYRVLYTSVTTASRLPLAVLSSFQTCPPRWKDAR